jgi:hypothetical protein
VVVVIIVVITTTKLEAKENVTQPPCCYFTLKRITKTVAYFSKNYYSTAAEYKLHNLEAILL